MGRAEYFSSFRQNADEFICSVLPGISHPQVQYSPGKLKPSFSFAGFYLFICLFINFGFWIGLKRWLDIQGRRK